MKYVTLDYVVRNVVVSLEESSLRRYQTYLQYCIRGFREFNLNNASTPKVVHLSMLPNKAVNLPSDYVKYVKIGICVNGRIVTLGLDESLCLNDNYSECGDPLEVVVDRINDGSYAFMSYGFPFLSYYHNNQWVEGLFSEGGGYNSRGYFKINEEKNQIAFASVVPDTDIILEYVSDGMSLDGSAIVPVECVEYLVAFTHWKRVEVKGSESEIERWRNNTMIAWKNLKHQRLMFTVEEYLDSSRKNVYQTPKR